MLYIFIAVTGILLFILICVISSNKNERKKCRIRESELHEKIHLLQKEIERLQSELVSEKRSRSELEAELKHHKENLSALLHSNLTSMPWLAGMIADFLTFDLEIEAKKLDWGLDVKREKKVASIREIRAEAKRRIEEAKHAVYQLEYLRALVPGIDDLLATEYEDLHFDGTIPDHDPTMDFLSIEEWQRLSENEKNQLALDRYIKSRKTNWQIGRDYELSVAYEYMQKGYQVDTFGSYMGLEDLGRDLIVKKAGLTLIIQCKYWSKQKQIHEKHIYQLYGTAVGYSIENDIPVNSLRPIFVTNTALSPMAKEVSEYLGVKFVEHHEMTDFPRIKCNIGKDEFGCITRIFHLPMDMQYDSTKIINPGEFYAFTVDEAVKAGFRRAYKWHNN